MTAQIVSFKTREPIHTSPEQARKDRLTYIESEMTQNAIEAKAIWEERNRMLVREAELKDEEQALINYHNILIVERSKLAREEDFPEFLERTGQKQCEYDLL